MYDSKRVDSNQSGVHKNLNAVVSKHLHSEFKKPFQTHNLEAFETFKSKVSGYKPSSLILDSCCGTAMSTRLLASAYPDSLVVGVDQSAKRLSKEHEDPLPENCCLLQANCEDFWRLCVEQGIVFERHFILYPNPWPKSEHFKRRWHGHPVFPYLKPLAKQTLLRSNWKLYLEEFALAWQLLTKSELRTVSSYDPASRPLTLFETKYAASGHELYELELF